MLAASTPEYTDDLGALVAVYRSLLDWGIILEDKQCKGFSNPNVMWAYSADITQVFVLENALGTNIEFGRCIIV